uniref:Uncharacterized protein n=1 Tax=Meloidogyne enterolobii TaxID=390850 RepID=A0A6V7V8T5_MELEN|nr:unnamed protein product [Meloidogyne enterolobii]
MILITLTLDILYELYQYFFIMPYIGGGIEPINEINDYWNFILVGYNASKTDFIFILLYYALPYLIVLVSVRKCRSANVWSANVGPQKSVRKCRSASVGPQVSVRKCRVANGALTRP